jgi:hypothetical protein
MAMEVGDAAPGAHHVIALDAIDAGLVDTFVRAGELQP